ncbi:uncharacterized protein LOC131048462 [Cryptomeria japonica]|uniref:uncharacterized protein LOC131048462 n=1 Tax=Cryptomeria japonica TaxID=3369 RepID=UPI0027D9D14A|nr:uncharacterized protein LOC131048462 [Cryptomeria japonica]
MLTGLGYPNMITDLYISECSELEMLTSLERLSFLERMNIQSCEKLHTVTLPNTVIKLTVQNCRELRRIRMDFKADCYEFSLVQLWISDCPELEALPCFPRLNCLEEIRIIRCAKLHEIALPITLNTLQLDACTELKNLAYVSHLKNLVQLIVTQCWHLELELHLEGMKSLEKVRIDGCRRLESILMSKCKNLKSLSGNFDGARLSICECPDNIGGIEELGTLGAMQLLYCSNAAIRNCIFKLKSVPSAFIQVVGEADNAAMANLKASLFPNAHFCPDIMTLNETIYHHAGSVGAIIICTVVDVDRPAPLHTLSKSYEVCEWNFNLRQGKWLITTVLTSRFYQTLYRCRRFEDVLIDHGIMKNWCALTVKKGKEWRTLHLLRTIMDKLHPQKRVSKRKKIILV